MKRISSFLIAALLFTGKIIAQPITRSFVNDSLENYINEGLTGWKLPGVALAIVKDGKVVLLKGYGVKEMGLADKVNENTLFMIGSNTKAFTATAVAMLDDEKKLSLDDKVQKWLPGFKLYDPWVSKEVNLRDLLSHRLGFETFQGDFMYFDSDLTSQEVIDKLGLVKPMYGFRSKWGYTNAAFGVAGEVIHKATGKTWADFIRERIFKPLGMDQSLALTNEIHAAVNKASAHTVVNGVLKKIPYGRIDNLSPAGSISSSVKDMSRWLLVQLGKGKLDDKQIIPSATIEETWTPHSILGRGGAMFNTGHFFLYGLGWFLEEYNGKEIVSHTGGVNGFVTSVTLIPEEKLGIVVLTNTDANGFFEALKKELIDAYMGLPFRNYSKGFLDQQSLRDLETQKELKAKRDTINSKPSTALPLAAYAGSYKHPVYGNMNITLEKGELIMRFEHHKGRLSKLEPLGGNRFLSTWNDPIYGVKVLPFTVENGKVKSLRVTVADFVEFTPYEFEKVE